MTEPFTTAASKRESDVNRRYHTTTTPTPMIRGTFITHLPETYKAMPDPEHMRRMSQSDHFNALTPVGNEGFSEDPERLVNDAMREAAAAKPDVATAKDSLRDTVPKHDLIPGIPAKFRRTF